MAPLLDGRSYDDIDPGHYVAIILYSIHIHHDRHLTHPCFFFLLLLLLLLWLKREIEKKRIFFFFTFFLGLLLLYDILIHENHMLAASRRHWQAALLVEESVPLFIGEASAVPEFASRRATRARDKSFRLLLFFSPAHRPAANWDGTLSSSSSSSAKRPLVKRTCTCWIARLWLRRRARAPFLLLLKSRLHHRAMYDVLFVVALLLLASLFLFFFFYSPAVIIIIIYMRPFFVGSQRQESNRFSICAGALAFLSVRYGDEPSRTVEEMAGRTYHYDSSWIITYITPLRLRPTDWDYFDRSDRPKIWAAVVARACGQHQHTQSGTVLRLPSTAVAMILYVNMESQKMRTFGRRGRKKKKRVHNKGHTCFLHMRHRAREAKRIVYVYWSSHHRDSWRSEMTEEENLFSLHYIAFW